MTSQGSAASPAKENIVDVDFNDALSSRYLAYALSTIMARSLPDVRDGLKPVHRRLIYAMQQLHLNPNTPFKKSARIVGDVMGKFHPHGDAAIYGALVRLAQDFSLRYPLIEGQGNFGNIDGDNAAAMRYTEARLSPFAQALLEGLDEDAVDFQPTYDGQAHEPMVLPSALPNLVINGSTGIAVGMATSIPPHNLHEVCKALTMLIASPNKTTKDLLMVVKGPDFPTGGIVVEDYHVLEQAYETGRGSLRLRGVYETQELKNGQYQIVVTQIPYMVEKTKLIERIAQLIIDKKIPNLVDVMDESTDELRLVLVPKSKQVNHVLLMEQLFRLSDLQTTITINFNALDKNRTPQVFSFKQMLVCYLDHRQEVEVRRARNRLSQVIHRLEMLAGYLIVYLNLDEVIAIIRDKDDPKQVLQQRFFLTDVQAEAILNMRLRSLRKLQEIEIRQEFEQLEQEKILLEHFLQTPELQWEKIKNQIQQWSKTYGPNTSIGKRRTIIAQAIGPIDWVAIEEKELENLTIYLSNKNWVWVQKGHDPQDQKYKEGDAERFMVKGTNLDKLLLFSTNGRFYAIPVERLPRGRQQEALPLLIDLGPNDEIVWAMVINHTHFEQELLLVNNQGKGFKIKVGQVIAQTKNGKQIFTIKDIPDKSPQEKQQVTFCIPLVGDHVGLIGQNRKILIIPTSDIPLLNKGQGVSLQKYKDGGVSDIINFNLGDGLAWYRNEKRIDLKDLRAWLGNRGGAGRLAPVGFPRTNMFTHLV